jgi:hypothetical protein
MPAADADFIKSVKSSSTVQRLNCAANYVKLDIRKTRVINLTWKTNLLYYIYKMCGSSATHMDSMKDLVFQIGSILCFHAHLDYIFSRSLRLFRLIRNVTSSFSTLDSLLMLYLTLVKPRFESA